MAALPFARGALAQSAMEGGAGPVQPDWPSLVANCRYPVVVRED